MFSSTVINSENGLTLPLKYIIASVGGLVYLLFALFAVKEHFYIVWLIPLAFMLLLLALFSVDRFFLLLLFFTPLSVQLRFLTDNPVADIFLPTEVMLALILLIMLFKVFNSREFNRKLFRHPVSILILIMLGWMFITSFTGTMILVSLKAFLARFWFVTAFYFLALALFNDRSFINKSLQAFMLGLVPVVLFHIIRLWGFGLFNQQAAHSTMWPFFNDHTSFGTVLAFFIPVVIWLIITARSVFKRLFYIVVAIVFIAGFVLSYSRAAWISLALAAFFSLKYFIGIPWKAVFTGFAIGILVLVLSWPSVVATMEGNRQDSSGNFGEHIRSITNITSDVSNIERINRWKSAVRMIGEKPVTGWGPGTYQFQYASYQFSHERSVISTNFGDAGNAHSEYLGAMVESGIPGTIIFILIVLFSIITGNRVWVRGSNKTRAISLALMSGLVTYFFHALFNSFLDTDKISAPFWMFIAALVIMDLKSGGDMHQSKQVKKGRQL